MAPALSLVDFTGVWNVNFERSIIRGSAPRRILMKIEHREPTLTQQILFTDAAGTEQRQTFTYEVGGESTNSIGGTPARTRARWEGRELVIESWLKTPDREFHFKDHWSMSDDGQTLTMAHRDDDLSGQVAVLERAPEAETTRFDRH